MPRKKSVSATKLIKAVESGLPSREIMEKFEIKTSAQLKALYLDALVDKGQATGITSGRSGSEKVGKKTKAIKVNKRGSLVLPRGIVDDFGFGVGDAFKIRKTRSGVSLKKV